MQAIHILPAVCVYAVSYTHLIDLGFVPIQDKYDAYAAAELLCQPSKHESFSYVIMESWLCERPVLVLSLIHISTTKIVQVPETVTYHGLLKGNVIPCSSVLMRREDALQYPMTHDELHEDYIVWLSMLRDGKTFAGVNEPLLKSRLGETGKSRKKGKSARMTYGVYRYMGIPVWKAVYYFCCYAAAGCKKYAGARGKK